MKEECTITNKNKLVVFQENRSKLTIENIDEVEGSKIIVDGCEITEGLRCDFMYLIKDIEFFIEVKGQDLEHAISQLKTTITKLSQNPKKAKKKSFIICTRSPLSSASIQNLQVKFRKNYNSELIIKSTPYKYKI
jgi:hypothetical protein